MPGSRIVEHPSPQVLALPLSNGLVIARGNPMRKAVITQARSPGDYAAGKSLIEEYAAALAIDLCVQNFSQEIANLPGIYGPPHGCLLIAGIHGELAGCVAVRGLNDGDCEIKRLYVPPAYRRGRVGRQLVETAIRFARKSARIQLISAISADCISGTHVSTREHGVRPCLLPDGQPLSFRATHPSGQSLSVDAPHQRGLYLDLQPPPPQGSPTCSRAASRRSWWIGMPICWKSSAMWT